MKTPIPPGLTPLFVAAALLVTPVSQGLAADRDPSQPPEKLGSRIVNFFKGLVDRDEPPAAYNEYPPTRSYPPQGQGRQPRRFNLDAPPPIPGGSDYERENYGQPERQTSRPRSNPDEEYDPPVSRQGSNAGPQAQQDLPYETPPSQPGATNRQNPVEPQTRRQEPSPSAAKTQAPKTNQPTAPKPNGTASKPASGNQSPVTTTSNSPVTSPDSPPNPAPRRQESAADEPSTASTTPSTPDPKPSTPSPAASGAPLVGSKTAKPGRVKSPYPPYNELDVTGLSSGSLAMDPTTQKVFRVP